MALKVTGAQQAQQLVQDIADRLRDMRPIMEVAAQDTKTLIDDSFATSTSPEGAPWAPLSEATQTINPRRTGGKPLVDTARLRNSVTTQAGASGFSFGTNVVYAGTHQFGRSSNRVFGKSPGPIPARPFLPITSVSGRTSLAPGGNAGRHWQQVKAMIAHWVQTGEVTD